MQVKDLITFYINESSNTLDVTFRLETDGDDQIRNDSISLDEVENFGYNFLNENNNDIFDEDELSEVSFIDNLYDDIVEDDDVISFLNEYYLINPNKLPTSELF